MQQKPKRKQKFLAADIGKIRTVLEELSGLHNTLADDLTHTLDEVFNSAKENDSARARRTAARALFAYLEGVVYGMKQTAYGIHLQTDPTIFSAAEVTILREETYELRDNGEIGVRSARLRSEANLCFALNAFERAFRCNVALELTGEDRTVFQRAVRIRDRLMHPKKQSDLAVSIDELGDLVKVFRWFVTTVNGALGDVLKRLGKTPRRSPSS